MESILFDYSQHGQVDKPFKMMGADINIVESDAGVDKSNKHMDTKLVVFVNDERIVLHAYNGTQNLMVQGKNFSNFVVKYLQPYFSQKIEESEDISRQKEITKNEK